MMLSDGVMTSNSVHTMDFSDKDSDNEDLEAEYFSKIYYVDKSTVEKSTNETSLPNLTADYRTNRFNSRRYWSLASTDNTVSNSSIPNKGVSDERKSRKSPERVSTISHSYNETTGPFSDKMETEVSKNVKVGDSRLIVDTEACKESTEIRKLNEEKLSDDENPDNTDSITFLKGLKRPSRNNITETNTDTGIISLDSSDDESIIEMKLIKRDEPLICIESSDDDEILATNTRNVSKSSRSNSNPSADKTRYSSPVPSIVSSTSDDFIQNDFTNLNMSKEGIQNFSFNFKLHGSDLGDGLTESNVNDRSKIESGKKDGKRVTSTPVNNVAKKVSKLNKSVNSSVSSTSDDFIVESLSKQSGESKTPKSNEKLITSTNSSYVKPPFMVKNINDSSIFATPKSKGKKSKTVDKKNYSVNENFIPAIDVYESESSDFPDSVVDVPISSKSRSSAPCSPTEIVDVQSICSDSTEIIEDTLIMANVINVNENNIYSEKIAIDPEPIADSSNSVKYSFSDSKLFKNGDKKLTLEEVIDDMKRFYNDSWGGEKFDHLKIKSNLPRSKEHWNINLSDKLFDNKTNKKNTCSLCHKPGHRIEKCPFSKKICYMCGTSGHYSVNCPNGICLQCGRKRNNGFKKKCNHCRSWKFVTCSICSMKGHPHTFCPDLWRRYHLTTKNEIPLIKSTSKKPVSNLYCSGCTKKGHFVDNCKTFSSQYSFSSPYIKSYTPIYTPDGVRSFDSNGILAQTNNRNDSNIDSAFLKEKSYRSENESTPSQNKRRIESSVEFEHGPSKKAKTAIDVKSQKTIINTVNKSEEIKSDDTIKYNEFENTFDKKIQNNENTTQIFIPKKRSRAIEFLSEGLKTLQNFIGDPIKLFGELCGLQKDLNRANKNSRIHRLRNIFKKIKDTRRKLNMILIGQLGLCNGNNLMTNLKRSIDTLNNNTIEYVTIEERNNINDLYSPIFTSTPRNDYQKLIGIIEKKRIHYFEKLAKFHNNKMGVNPFALQSKNNA